MYIREAKDSKLNQVLYVERLAFGQDEEAELVRELLIDPSAKPILSLLAFKEDVAVGHILFTTAHLENSENTTKIALLAPLAVIPDAQNQGIGGKLIKRGLETLSESGVDLVFVLGYPEYYSKHGFKPAGCLGFEASYPIASEHSDAWMVQALRPDVIGSVSGKVICADAINKPKYWQE
ncbi:MAG: N-acetyltransferase [Xenococcaceae cyanobacterium MO_188.B19]|nr:N-acetyltransferase [Xenococcaceae cyanobacterium MO_188.B19]